MSDYPSSQVFAVGLNAARAEHRSTDYAGRPVDPAAETETARTERIRALQDRWQERGYPSADPVSVLHEWMAASPANRTSAFAMRIAEHPDLMPDAEVEPGPGQRPKPGGLIERMASQYADRASLAQRMAGR